MKKKQPQSPSQDQPQPQIFKVRVTGEVLDTATATRKYHIDGQLLTFGRDPLYLRADELPKKLTSDPYLRIDTVPTAPPDVVVIDLKAERVQEDATLAPGADLDLKAERVQEE
jgi:hypothetical protein